MVPAATNSAPRSSEGKDPGTGDTGNALDSDGVTGPNPAGGAGGTAEPSMGAGGAAQTTLRGSAGPTVELIRKIRVDERGATGAVDGCAFSTQGDMAICGMPGAVRVFRTADWSIEHDLRLGVERTKSVRFSPDDALVAGSGQNGTVHVFRLSDGELVADLPHESSAQVLPGDDNDGNQPNVEAVEWSSDSRYLFTGGQYDGVVRIWRVADWSLVGWIQGQEYNRQVEFMAISGNDVLATCGDEGFAYLFQFTSAAERKPVAQKAGEPVVVEAEDFDANLSQGDHRWELVEDETASSGLQIQALPDDGENRDELFQTWDPTVDSPKLDYRLMVATAGTYQVWVRVRGAAPGAHSVHVGVDGSPADTADRIVSEGMSWAWTNATVDKLVLSPNAGFQPQELGPERSPRE